MKQTIKTLGDLILFNQKKSKILYQTQQCDTAARLFISCGKN